MAHLGCSLDGGIYYQAADVMGRVIAFDRISHNVFDLIAHQRSSQFPRGFDKEITIPIQYCRIDLVVRHPTIDRGRLRAE